LKIENNNNKILNELKFNVRYYQYYPQYQQMYTNEEYNAANYQQQQQDYSNTTTTTTTTTTNSNSNSNSRKTSEPPTKKQKVTSLVDYGDE